MVKLRTLLNAGQLQDEELQTRQLQNEDLEDQAEERAAINKSYQKALKVDPKTGAMNIDEGELTKSLAIAGHGAVAPSILMGLNKYKESKATATKTQQEVAEHSKNAMGSLGYAIQQTGYDPNFADMILTHEMSQPEQTDQSRAQLQQLQQTLKQKPELLKTIVDNMVNQSPKQQELATQKISATARGGPAYDAYRYLVDEKNMDPLDALRQVGEAGGKGKVTQEQNKLAFQGVLEKLSKAGVKFDPTKITSALLDKAVASGAIDQADKALGMAYLGANPTPTTNLSVKVEGAAAQEAIRQKDKYFEYSEPG
jgi:hypothetical protein